MWGQVGPMWCTPPPLGARVLDLPVYQQGHTGTEMSGQTYEIY